MEGGGGGGANLLLWRGGISTTVGGGGHIYYCEGKWGPPYLLLWRGPISTVGVQKAKGAVINYYVKCGLYHSGGEQESTTLCRCIWVQ